MKQPHARYALEYIGYCMLRGVIRRLPHGWVRRLGRGLGRAAYFLMGGRRRLALTNLGQAMPERSERARARIARACFAHFGATFCEVVSAARFRPEDVDQYFRIDGLENLRAALAQERGVFLMTGHLGAWELAAYPLGRHLPRLDMVARAPNNPRVAAELACFRERFNNRLIEKSGAAGRILQAIRNRGTVAVVIDSRAGSTGVQLPFFDRPAWFHTVMAMVALHRGTPIVPVFCRPDGKAGYRITIHPSIVPQGRGQAAESALTRRCLALIENEIRRTPEQWMWMHDLWRY